MIVWRVRLSETLTLLVELVRAEAARKTWRFPMSVAPVVPSSLGRDASAIGASVDSAASSVAALPDKLPQATPSDSRKTPDPPFFFRYVFFPV